MTSKFNYLSDFYEEEISNGIFPELYIDKEILAKENISFKEKNHKVYKINGDLFYEDDRNQNELQEFGIELIDENEDEDLIFEFEIKQNTFVVLVNSIILLSCYQWNTITDEYPPKCLVCDIVIADPSRHIKTDDHIINLEEHKPLKKFNLHITRLIGDQYHCAVCNEVYEIYNDTHLDSERHLERMLYATNRATDNDFDVDINNDNGFVNDNDNNETKKDTLSTSESGFDSDGFYDLNYFNNNKSTIRSYASVVKQTKSSTSFVEHVTNNKTFTIESDIYHMILRPKTTEFYCMLCIRFDDVINTSDHCKSEEHLKKLKQCEIMEHEEHFIRKVTTKFYHCGTCNNLQLAGEVEAHLKAHGKKHKNNDKENEQENKTNENSDTGNAQQNKVNGISVTGIAQENKINENNNTGNEQQNKVNENTDTGKVQENKTNEFKTQNTQYNVHAGPSNIRILNIYDDIIINRFNCNIRVTYLSYNLILRRVVDYICLLCNVVSPDMTMHLRDPRHVVCLQNVPFQPFFGIHLVRMLQQYSHCAICNVLVNTAVIHLHTSSQPHLMFLNKALNPINNILMSQTNIDLMLSLNKQITENVQTNTNTETLNQTSVTETNTNTETLNQTSVTETNTNTETLNQTSVTETNTNTETLNQTSFTETNTETETVSNQSIDLNQTDNLDYDIDNVNILKEFVYLKIKKTLLKVSYVSYHTLLHTGDCNRYCFICSYKITKSLRGHIESEAHMNRMKKCKFIMNYEKDLFRQVKLTYHCCICNVLVKNSDIKNHLIWPLHKENTNYQKFRNRVHLNNIINVEFQTKETCFNEKEPQIQLVFKMVSGKKTNDNIGGIVINIPPFNEIRGKIFSISWDAWQGITRSDHGVHCNLCHDFFVDIDAHLKGDVHKKLVSSPIEKQYLPACIRKITDVALNCITCNLVFSNKGKSIKQHLAGKKHLLNYEETLQTAFTDVTLT